MIVLSFVAGAVDAVAFLALDQVFAAIMTGNLLLLGFGLASPGIDTLGPLVALAAFLLGAGAFGRLDDGRSDRRALLSRLAAAEAGAVALAALILIGFEGGDGAQRFGAIVALAGVMGFRNATIRAVAVPELRTTVMTFAVAGLAADAAARRALGAADGRRAAGVVAMVAGAALSALILREMAPSWALVMVVAAELVALTLLRPHPAGRVG